MIYRKVQFSFPAEINLAGQSCVVPIWRTKSEISPAVSYRYYFPVGDRCPFGYPLCGRNVPGVVQRMTSRWGCSKLRRGVIPLRNSGARIFLALGSLPLPLPVPFSVFKTSHACSVPVVVREVRVGSTQPTLLQCPGNREILTLHCRVG